MKNRIWVGMNKDCKSYTFTEKLEIRNGLFVGSNGRRLETDNNMDFNYYPLDIYNLNLKPLEIVEVIIDTETQKYEVVRPREVGWYLTVWGGEFNKKEIRPRYWDSNNWRMYKESIALPDSEIIVLSEKLPDNAHLRSLE